MAPASGRNPPSSVGRLLPLRRFRATIISRRRSLISTTALVSARGLSAQATSMLCPIGEEGLEPGMTFIKFSIGKEGIEDGEPDITTWWNADILDKIKSSTVTAQIVARSEDEQAKERSSAIVCLSPKGLDERVTALAQNA